MITDNRLAYSVDDASRMIGISKTQLYRLINAHELSSLKLGHRTLIEAQSLRDLMDRHVRRAEPAASAGGAKKGDA
jgi:excisionase family DNA binding protein